MYYYGIQNDGLTVLDSYGIARSIVLLFYPELTSK